MQHLPLLYLVSLSGRNMNVMGYGFRYTMAVKLRRHGDQHLILPRPRLTESSQKKQLNEAAAFPTDWAGITNQLLLGLSHIMMGHEH
jgi:hypothetical protein